MTVIHFQKTPGNEQFSAPAHTRLYELYDQHVPALTCSKSTLGHILHMIEATALQQSGDSLLIAGVYEHNRWIICAATVSAASGTRLNLPSRYFEKRSFEMTYEGFFLALCPELCFILCGYPQKTDTPHTALWFDVRFSFLPDDVDRALELLQASTVFNDALSALVQKKRSAQPQPQVQSEFASSFLHEIAAIEAQQHQHVVNMNEQLQAQLNWRDDFITMLVHDLRTPLHGITLLLQMLNADTQVRSVKNFGSLLDLEIQSAMHLDALIQTLLDLNRLEAQTFAVQLEPINMRQSILTTLDSFLLVLEHARITLITEFVDQPLSPWGDPILFARVMRNLIENAIRFSLPNSTITVRIAPSEHHKRALIDITDTGRGIPAATLPHVFERHFQAQRRDQRGAGVGLYFCLLAMQAQQGDISVASTSNQGTTFTLWLPMHPPASHSP